jgi:hypothetical protein
LPHQTAEGHSQQLYAVQPGIEFRAAHGIRAGICRLTAGRLPAAKHMRSPTGKHRDQMIIRRNALQRDLA